MIDIDEVLAAAIRTTFLQLNGPASRLPQHIEVAIAQRIRAALEQEGVIVAPARRIPSAAKSDETKSSQHAPHSN
ncbi:hypothetical protein QEV83_07320 [Methylocapsa sp. D3K7]|uniref:hypothetical protein n=1 Tax=Methylocapsa sp. D3K7 TaxID=3041435 RepID=UPI00244E6F8E|nr:hypothetical protein [Methylocapsa sp. D3K7]WGJ16047.1 hypothetical protein QEV83_07320 [Methylocapsa sp. D3K7]